MWFSASLYELGNLGEESVMAKNKAENYLDNLLNSVNYDLKDDKGTGGDLSAEFGSLGEQSDDDFLRQFESELESEEYNSFISGFYDDF